MPKASKLAPLLLLTAAALAREASAQQMRLDCIIGKCLRVWSQCVAFRGDGDHANDPSAPVAYRGNATFEMDSDGDFMTRHYDFDSKMTYVAGKTRVTVNLESSRAGSLPAAKYSSVFDEKCGAPSVSGAPYSSEGVALGALRADFQDNADGTAKSSVTIDKLVDYDKAASMRLFDDAGRPLACCDLVPPRPDLPDDWSATIEANINNRGYSISRREHHSARHNAVRIETVRNWDRTVVITHVGNDTKYVIHVNDTFPDGHCVMDSLDGRAKTRIEGSDHHMRSTASMFHWVSSDGGAADEYVPGRHDVRGIDCEKWQRSFSIPASGKAPTNPASASAQPPSSRDPYLLEFYFPFTHWRNDKSDHHRMLKRITLTKNSTDTQKRVYHVYDFVAFTPYLDAVDGAALFDHCRSFPGMDTCGCVPQALACSSGGSGYSAGAVAGAAVGSVLGVLLLAGVGLFACGRLGGGPLSKLHLNPIARGQALFSPFGTARAGTELELNGA